MPQPRAQDNPASATHSDSAVYHMDASNEGSLPSISVNNSRLSLPHSQGCDPNRADCLQLPQSSVLNADQEPHPSDHVSDPLSIARPNVSEAVMPTILDDSSPREHNIVPSTEDLPSGTNADNAIAECSASMPTLGASFSASAALSQFANTPRAWPSLANYMPLLLVTPVEVYDFNELEYVEWKVLHGENDNPLDYLKLSLCEKVYFEALMPGFRNDLKVVTRRFLKSVGTKLVYTVHPDHLTPCTACHELLTEPAIKSHLCEPMKSIGRTFVAKVRDFSKEDCPAKYLLVDVNEETSVGTVYGFEELGYKENLINNVAETRVEVNLSDSDGNQEWETIGKWQWFLTGNEIIRALCNPEQCTGVPGIPVYEALYCIKDGKVTNVYDNHEDFRKHFVDCQLLHPTCITEQQPFQWIKTSSTDPVRYPIGGDMTSYDYFHQYDRIKRRLHPRTLDTIVRKRERGRYPPQFHPAGNCQWRPVLRVKRLDDGRLVHMDNHLGALSSPVDDQLLPDHNDAMVVQSNNSSSPCGTIASGTVADSPACPDNSQDGNDNEEAYVEPHTPSPMDEYFDCDSAVEDMSDNEVEMIADTEYCSPPPENDNGSEAVEPNEKEATQLAVTTLPRNEEVIAEGTSRHHDIDTIVGENGIHIAEARAQLSARSKSLSRQDEQLVRKGMRVVRREERRRHVSHILKILYTFKIQKIKQGNTKSETWKQEYKTLCDNHEKFINRFYRRFYCYSSPRELVISLCPWEREGPDPEAAVMAKITPCQRQSDRSQVCCRHL